MGGFNAKIKYLFDNSKNAFKPFKVDALPFSSDVKLSDRAGDRSNM